MSISKQTLCSPPIVPLNQPDSNPRLQHVSHLLSRVYSALKQDAPNQAQDVTKYDLIARNIDECLLLLSFRARQAERMDRYASKIKKAINKL